MILKIITFLAPSDYARLATVSRHFSGSYAIPFKYTDCCSHRCTLSTDFLQEDLLWKDLFGRTWPEAFRVEEENLKRKRENTAKSDNKVGEGKKTEDESSGCSSPPLKKLKGDYSELQSPHSDFEASVRAGQEKVISDPFGHASEAARPWLPILNFFPGVGRTPLLSFPLFLLSLCAVPCVQGRRTSLGGDKKRTQNLEGAVLCPAP